MIKLIFSIQRETFVLEINQKEIYYCDRKLKRLTRLIPIDIELNKRIILSRNRLPKNLLVLFNLNEEEQKEYDSCNTEEELAEICINDCKKNGAILQKKEVL
jgi:hypothetical protein